MTNSLKLTLDISKNMLPGRQVYRSHSLPMKVSDTVLQWNNNDENYIIELDFKTNSFTGHFYAWNDETEEWDDANDTQMTDSQILDIIHKDNLLIVK